MSRTLSVRLKEDTAPAHQSAERTGIVGDILHRRLKREDYLRFARDLHEVYAALEAALQEQRSHPAVAPIVFTELERAPSLAADLEQLHGPAWRSDLVPSDAVARYVESIRRAAREHPERLTAHAYVRYLGDLSGGQILKKLIGESLGLDGVGLSFYEFPEVADAAGFKQAYRARLDALPVSAEEADGIIEEAREAFLHNMALAQAATGLAPEGRSA